MAKAQSPLKAAFDTLKQQGLVRLLDEFLITRESEDDHDRKNETNSPSSALGCSRANYYQRLGTRKDAINPRLRRIFDNGHGTHDRLQGYLEAMGTLLMREVPLFNKEEEIQGHTDGIMDMTGRRTELKVLEIKSINTNQFGSLREAKEDHRAQGNVYLFCLEAHRKMLKRLYPTLKDFKASIMYRRVTYSARYQHLESGRRYTRDQKIGHKVAQHMQLDELLYGLPKPIRTVVFLYEDKNTQDLKDFEVDWDDDLLDEVLEKYRINNKHWAAKIMPPKECRTKADGKWCNFVNTCFAKEPKADPRTTKARVGASPFKKLTSTKKASR